MNKKLYILIFLFIFQIRAAQVNETKYRIFHFTFANTSTKVRLFSDFNMSVYREDEESQESIIYTHKDFTKKEFQNYLDSIHGFNYIIKEEDDKLNIFCDFIN